MYCSRVIVGILLASFAVIGLVAGAEQEHQRVSREGHNEHRRRHHVNALSASDDLNNRATRCAQYYIDTGRFDHSCPHKNGAGENLFGQSGGNPSNTAIAQSSTRSWYSEESKYDYNKDYQPGTGHFTAMVWKNSREMGFGVARGGNRIVACALYSPHGNVVGHFRDNVLRP